MLRAALLLAVASTAAAGQTFHNRDYLKDQITSLPGAPPVDFDMFSGYIQLGDEERYMFYWLAESQQKSQATDPLVLWTNGGPGCSGLGGFMTEQGPFRPVNGTSLKVNPHRYTLASLLPLSSSSSTFALN